ncbi:CDP-glycerol glycerophosphotransferase family protein [Candidatus Sulfidibacterium hydrothermale]|uniref:CDP-glycerol glycerophosphotransferase family protein n=1 Tax=Candidatus Sulfidibacterium hydrothermale TaxID=2875962 RepID=UPI001F0AADD2|nr:CDP-glycerol glycerophosphotransferase family protein [Candidatus Sulfidibacterium hydrothermale]UBM61659.1 CDP-glycerol glycerophosphotransferase family protein [Candidatus Sulfidibacterium hydrothermale]
MEQFITLFLRPFVKAIYRLACQWTKEDNAVIIAGHGAKYFTGNNQYFFQYLCQIQPVFPFFFFTKDKKTYQNLQKKYPGKILYAYHAKTFVRMAKAKVLMVTTGPDDFFPFPLSPKKKIINLWHGTPLKNIGLLAPDADTKSLSAFSEAIDYFCVSSGFEGKIMQKAFRLPEQKIFISGLPKNDFIRHDHSSFLHQHPVLREKIILYAPTFREKEMAQKSLAELFPLEKLQQLLEEQHARFLYRSHINTTDLQAIEGFDRILSASPSIFPDPQPLLYFTDMLITDYSGIYFDYLLLNRPIIFYNYDDAEYRAKRNFLFHYEENTPGPKVQNREELLKVIRRYFEYPDQDAEQREKIKNKFHTFTDGKACERIYQKITKLL